MYKNNIENLLIGEPLGEDKGVVTLTLKKEDVQKVAHSVIF